MVLSKNVETGVPVSSEPIDPNIGHVVANRYHLVELVGKGAMGRVYRAEELLLGGVTAVKFLSPALVASTKMRERFKTEARTCAQLGQKSIHIVSVTDYGVDENDTPFYVMEYLQGASLGEVITPQALPLPRFLSLARQICLGLQFAHQGIEIDEQLCPIIHRDIKPSNILVIRDALVGGELVKILDFGIAKLLQEDSGQTHSFMGTLPYSSPEQMEGLELDPRSDIYSLGIMLYEMLTGKMPLQVETHSFGSWYKAHHQQPPRRFNLVQPGLKLPKSLEALVMGCLEKKPGDRPQSISDVLKALVPLEERYSSNRQVSSRIGEALARQSLAEKQKAERPISLLEQIYQTATWPKTKPVAQIVFPQIYTHGTVSVPTIWVMLPLAEIRSLQLNRLYNRIYKNVLCTMSPHPMALWLTALYNRFHSIESGPRWLRCYLDLKSSSGQDLMRLLISKGEYQILLFALEDPLHCAHIITASLPDAQRERFKNWVTQSQSALSVGTPSMSKTLLQAEFEEKLKPKVLAELNIETS